MENKNSGIRSFGIMLIVYGVINVFSYINFKEFKEICAGLPQSVIYSIFAFGIIYSIMCIKCGSSILKLEEWARKIAVILVLTSLLLGLFLTPIMLENAKGIYRQKFGAAANLDAAIRTIVIFAVFFTIFELAFVLYFTRPKVKEYFIRIDKDK